MPNKSTPGTVGSGEDSKQSTEHGGLRQDDRGTTRATDRERRPRDAEGRFVERRRSASQQPYPNERRVGGQHAGR